MEYLMDALAYAIKDPLEDPFLFEWIVIQSRGMKQWISIELAKKFGICANIKYSFPREIIEKFSLESQSDSNLLFWKILDLLPKLIHDNKFKKAFSSIKNYLEGADDGIRLYQLTNNIASLFDDYRIYRPDILLNWQNNIDNIHDNKNFVTWQSVLFKELIEAGFEYSSFQNTENLDKNIVPKRISVFGISSYPPIFLNFFEKISFVTDINLFMLVPSKEFFAYSAINDIEEAELDEDQFIEQGNPLVASLGKAGRDLQLLIENFDYHEPLPDLWYDPINNSTTMLSYLQSDILNLFERKKCKDREPIYISTKDDDSISIHSCHTPMRESQVLKDQLLNLFENNPELKPDDVIVMMPDIESYAPLIEAVFSVEHRLPYTISDRKQSTESRTIKAFLKIINIITSRFELHSVLDLLSQREIAEKFSIDQSELIVLEKYVENAGIRWGIDSIFKRKAGFAEFNENTWQFGIQRLMLGYAMPDNIDSLFCNVLPASCPEGKDSEIIGKLALFIDSLFSNAVSILSSKTIDNSKQKHISYFCNKFKQILHSMIAKTSHNKAAFLLVLESIRQIETESEQAGFEDKVEFDVVVKILEKKLSQPVSIGSFMTGGITFCNLMPMRSIPFKIIGLMGMSEKDFPRKPNSKSFDLIMKFPRIGDKNIRNEDRYLFLEAILSARENFIITYTGFDIKNNAPIPCSTIVSELIDVIENSFKIESKDDLITYHHLQSFSSQYFFKASIADIKRSKILSFSSNAYKISKKLINRSIKQELFKNKALSQNDFKENISIDDLCYFFKQPIVYIIKNKLGIILQESESLIEKREPLLLDQLDIYKIGSDILEKSLTEKQIIFDYEKVRAEGLLAFGEKGKVDFQEIYAQALSIYEKASMIIQDDIVPLQNFELNFNGIKLTGAIDLIRKKCRRFILTFGKLNPQRLLNAWIYHIALNAYSKDKSYKTILVGKNTRISKDIAQEILFSEIDGQKAYELLSDLVNIFKSGLNKPFIFFPETSYGFTKLFLNTDQNRSKSNLFNVMQKCKSKWYNSFFNSGDRINRYNNIYFGEQDLFQNFDYFLNSGFIENSIRVFRPLIENIH